MSYAPIFIDHRWIAGIVEGEEPRVMTEDEVEDACEALNALDELLCRLKEDE